MLEYKPFEMHAHTLHSDGVFTVEGLASAARGRELAGVLLTDHNTMSGFDDITPQIEQQGVPLIRGIEWTTFFGHMLVIGAERFVDWRKATPETIDLYTSKIQQAKGAVGIAHPYALGSPFCTGCHWEFRVQQWQHINYIEVWSGPFPAFEPYNEPGFQLWTDLLNQGHRLAATSGRDWHGPDGDKRLHMPVTYLGVADGVVNTHTVREALRAGRVYVTGGPALTVRFAQDDRQYGIGDTLKPGNAQIKTTLDYHTRFAQWDGFGIKPKLLHLVQNGAPVLSLPLLGEGLEETYTPINLWPGWLRLEVMGDYMGKTDQLLAFTSPIYIKG